MHRIGIVDDHELVRGGLTLLVSSFEGVKVVIEACNGLQLLELLNYNTVDILLLDIQMPDMDGYETCVQVRRLYPDIKILMLSQLTTKESIQKVLESGAHGFFSKNSKLSQLETAINNVCNNDYYFGSDLASILREAILLESNSKIHTSTLSVAFSSREMDIIKLACKEYSSAEMADILCINVRTIESHRQRIMDKTLSKNFIGVILYALKHGQIGMDAI